MNIDGKMSYKDFMFPLNPSIIRIVHSRKVNQHKTPFGDNMVSDMGENGRIIKGEGEFYGENCIDVFLELKRVFESGGGGMLYIPSQKPIYAMFTTLDIIAQDMEGVIKYSFEFIENKSKSEDIKSVTCIADGKSTLWDIAYRYGKYIEKLIELNPSIRRPDFIIEQGSRVVLC